MINEITLSNYITKAYENTNMYYGDNLYNPEFIREYESQEDYELCRDKILNLLKLNPNVWDVYFTNSGTTAVSTALDWCYTEDCVYIKSNHEHVSVDRNPHFQSNYYVIELERLLLSYSFEGTIYFWEKEPWYCNLKENIKNKDIVICIVGSQTLTGEITPQEIIDRIYEDLKSVAKSIKIILDAQHEMFVEKRNYKIFDFVCCGGYLGFSARKLGIILYKKKKYDIKPNYNHCWNLVKYHLDYISKRKPSDYEFTNRYIISNINYLVDKYQLKINRKKNNFSFGDNKVLQFFEILNINEFPSIRKVLENYPNYFLMLEDNKLIIRISGSDLIPERNEICPIWTCIDKLLELGRKYDY